MASNYTMIAGSGIISYKELAVAYKRAISNTFYTWSIETNTRATPIKEEIEPTREEIKPIVTGKRVRRKFSFND